MNSVRPERRHDRVRYAVLFKTHFWDSFTQRQFERLRSKMDHGDLFVLVDETNGPVPNIAADNVISVTNDLLLKMGFSERTPIGSLLWYNIDYVHSYFWTKFPDYDYYMTFEYDAVINADVDSFIERVAVQEADFVGFPLREPMEEWVWSKAHAPLYGREVLLGYLSCIGVFSNRAMELLYRRRLEIAEQLRTGQLSVSPYVEAFIPTELSLRGFRLDSLSSYGSTNAYEWWPPFHEADLDKLDDETFIHPVLEGKRYVISTVRHAATSELFKFGRARGLLAEKLYRYSCAECQPYIHQEIRRRIRDKFPRLAKQMDLLARWQSAGFRSLPSRKARGLV